MLYKHYIFPVINSHILYVENNNYFTYSVSSLRKFKTNNVYNTYINDSEISINHSLFNSNTNKIKFKNNIFNNQFNKKNYKLLKFFKEFFYENKSKLKIIGRGWKLIKYQYQLLIKLGYSHMIFLNLSPILKNKIKKKKKYYTFYGVFNTVLTTELNKIKLMRIPDNYTRKGIFYNKIYL